MRRAKRILVTGARSPVALEWVRGLARAHFEVIAADTSTLTLTRFSRHLTAYETYAPARENPGQFNRDLRRIRNAHAIDLIIPTCEELFWIRESELLPTPLFHPGQQTARLLHDKLYLRKLEQETGISTPPTWTRDEMPNQSGSWVLKPRFSRSGDRCRRLEGRVDPTEFAETDIAQPWIEGPSLCCSAFAKKGRLLTAVCYEPVICFRKNKGGVAGPAVAFKRVQNEELTARTQKIIHHLNYTGAIGIDAISPPDGPPVIHDINPRTTSGIHLLPSTFDFGTLLRGEPQPLPAPDNYAAWIPLAALFSESPVRSLFRATRTSKLRDVISSPLDPMPVLGQLAMLERLRRLARIHGRSVMTVATIDIEWNGEHAR